MLPALRKLDLTFNKKCGRQTLQDVLSEELPKVNHWRRSHFPAGRSTCYRAFPMKRRRMRGNDFFINGYLQ
jgi:hypothetical protein